MLIYILSVSSVRWRNPNSVNARDDVKKLNKHVAKMFWDFFPFSNKRLPKEIFGSGRRGGGGGQGFHTR